MPISRSELRRVFERRRIQGQQDVRSSLHGLETVAAKRDARKLERESKEFNPINAVIEGGTAFVASGANPLAAVAAAAGSTRGKRTDVVKSATKGGAAGVTIGATTIEDLIKPENADKLATVAQQAGAPKDVVSGLQTYSKAQALRLKAENAAKVREEKEDAAKLEKKEKALADKKKEELDRENKLELEKIKAGEKSRLKKEKEHILQEKKDKKTQITALENQMINWKRKQDEGTYADEVAKMNIRADSLIKKGLGEQAQIILKAIEEIEKRFNF